MLSSGTGSPADFFPPITPPTTRFAATRAQAAIIALSGDHEGIVIGAHQRRAALGERAADAEERKDENKGVPHVKNLRETAFTSGRGAVGW